MKTIINLINTIKNDANESARLAREIARIPAVDIDSIKVWTAPTSERTDVNSSVEFMGIHAKFAWHAHAIEINENYSGELIVKYDSKVIGEVFWSALWGKLESNSNCTITKAQRYILDCLWKCVYNISAKGRPYEKVALPKTVQYGDCTIYAEGATIYAVFNSGETIRVMGNTWRGLLWTDCDCRVLDIQKVIKKAFIEY